jgi:hypothetical protein
MINLLVASTIMRSKFKINCLNLVSCTCGWFLALIISHLCIKTFDLMIALRLTNRSWDQNSLIMLYFEFQSHDWFVSHKNDHEIKTLKSIIRQFRPHENCRDQEIESIIRNFDLMIDNLISWKSWISISWNSTSWSIPEKTLFYPLFCCVDILVHCQLSKLPSCLKIHFQHWK